MNAAEIRTWVIDTAAALAGRSPDEVAEDQDLVVDLGMDSFDLVELVMAIENELNIEITDNEMMKISTVKDAINKAIDLGSQ